MDIGCTKNITFAVARFNIEMQTKSVFQNYKIPYQVNWTILDALKYIKDHIDSTLTFRASCGMGICGSCAVMINEEPKLACSTFIRDYLLENIIKIEPLPSFPIIRDLVIDIGAFIDKLKNIKPWIIRKYPEENNIWEYTQTPRQLARYQKFSMCINCVICYAVCPAYSCKSIFIGPAALAIAYRYNEDSRDEGSLIRAEITAGDAGAINCTISGNCSKFCPKNVNPGRALNFLKNSVVTTDNQ